MTEDDLLKLGTAATHNFAAVLLFQLLTRLSNQICEWRPNFCADDAARRLRDRDLARGRLAALTFDSVVVFHYDAGF